MDLFSIAARSKIQEDILSIKDSTGLDENVIQFLSDKSDVNEFLHSVYTIVDESVKNYIQ